LTERLGGADIWAKREDCNSGLAFGGNKTRKLEYVVADTLAQGCDTLVSIGGVQSNHTRQVAAVAARLGMKCVCSSRRAGWTGQIARATAELIGVVQELTDDEIVLDDRYHAGTYGIPDERTLEAMRLVARLDGMITDPVYEGKSMGGADRSHHVRRDSGGQGE
jgi:1-aminocyclopropane-1-carboxylate deaminase/D-cysteine desulfhydrase-like pyridoxal-dependent ACC family enzyme